MVDFCPVYFQACKDASPIMSGVYLLAFSSIVPSGLITGLSITATKRYRPQIWVGWAIVIVGFGLMSTVSATDTLGKSIGFFVIIGLGAGCVTFFDRKLFLSNSELETSIHDSVVNAALMYPILAPLSVTQNAPALAFMWFLSAFAGVGIQIPFYHIIMLSLTSWCDLVYYRSGVSRSEALSSRTNSRRSFLRPLSNPSHKGLLSCMRSSPRFSRTPRKLGSRSKLPMLRVLRCCGKSWLGLVAWDSSRRCS